MSKRRWMEDEVGHVTRMQARDILQEIRTSNNLLKWVVIGEIALFLEILARSMGLL